MKKLILIALTITATNLFAVDDGVVSWVTLIRPLPCSGGYHSPKMPNTQVSTTMWEDSFHFSTNAPISGTIYTPRNITYEGYTEVSAGTISSPSGYVQSNQFLYVTQTLDGICCDHTNGQWILEVKDIATFTGGLLASNDTKIVTFNFTLPQHMYRSEGFMLSIGHRVDGSALREQTLNLTQWGDWSECPAYAKFPTMILNFGTNKHPAWLHIRNGPVSNSGSVYTNANCCDTNWGYAAPVETDGNGEVDVFTEPWHMPTNNGYFKYVFTNAP